MDSHGYKVRSRATPADPVHDGHSGRGSGLASPPRTPAATDPHYDRRWLILMVVLVAQLVVVLDATVVNIALPSAQRDLGFSNADRQWVITAYSLAFGSLLPLGGRLGDAFGRKRMFLGGLAGFAIASAVGGAAPDIGVLLAARAVQGAFAAILAPAALSLIAVTFTELKELNKAYAIFGAVTGSAGAVGLLLGGVLTSYVNWRWCLYINIVFAVVGLTGGLLLLHHVDHPDKPKLSVPSTIIGSAALFGIVFGAAKAQTDGWGAAVTIGSLVGGVVLLAGFVVLQHYDRSPLIPLRVLADRNRGAAYLAQAVTNGAVFAVMLFLTYYLQGVLHYSPIKTGIAFLPLAVVIVVAATITQGQLLAKLTMRAILCAGLIVSAAGIALLTNVTATTSYPEWVLPGLILLGAGAGAILVVAVSMGQRGVDPRDAGTAGAMNNVSQQIGAAVSIAAISTIVATATSTYLSSHAPSATTIVQATVHGFHVGFWCAAGLFASGAVLMGVLVRPRTRLGHDADQQSGVPGNPSAT